MSINSPVLPWLLGLAAVAVLVLLVIGLPRINHRVAAATVRAAQSLTVTALALACAGSALNNQYLFYTSWGDLVSADKQVAHTISRGAMTPAQVPLAAAVKVVRSLPHLPRPGQREQVYQVTGERSGVKGEVIVHLPDGYDPHSSTPYPVVVMFAGYPGAPRSNIRAFGLNSSWEAAARKAGVRSPIVVMPQINTPRHSIDTECIDDPTGRLPKTETWLGKDVPAWIASHFRVSDRRDHWSTMGFSYGGWCATQIAMLHPEVFGGGVGIMGYFQPQFDRGGPNPLARFPKVQERYDLNRMARVSPPPVSLMLMSSRNDKLAYPGQVKFVGEVRAPLSVTSVVLSAGGHRVDIIEPELPRIMRWLRESLPGFRA